MRPSAKSRAQDSRPAVSRDLRLPTARGRRSQTAQGHPGLGCDLSISTRVSSPQRNTPRSCTVLAGWPAQSTSDRASTLPTTDRS